MRFLPQVGQMKTWTKDRFAVFSILFAISLALALCLLVSFAYTFKRQIENELTSSLTRIEENISNKFSNTEEIVKSMNSQISANPTNKEHIREILQKFRSAPELKESFSWTIFSWCNADNLLTIDAEYGIMKKPIYLGSREYLPRIRSNPNQLHFGSPIFGSTSKKWMIPSGVGVVDEKRNGAYLGAVIIGFEIESLAKSLFKLIDNDLISIDMFDKSGNLILTLGSDYTGSAQKLSQNIIAEKQHFFQGFLKKGSREIFQTSLLKDKHAFLLKKLEKYPYFLVASYNKKALSSNLWRNFYSRLIEILAMICLASLIILSKNKPLSKEYLSFSAFAGCFTISISLIFGYFSFQNNFRENLKLARSEAKNIESIISETFDNTNQINNYLGQQIAQQDYVDLNFVLELFRSAQKISHQSIEALSWSSFDWVDDKGMQRVNSRLGIHKSPIDMSSRLYVDLCPKNPWKLQLSFPALGKPSNSWVIPAGTGILNKNNLYLGAVVVGFDISELTFKLNQRINKKVSFVVLDENLRIVLKSSNVDLERDNDFFQKNFHSKAFKKNPEISENPFAVGDVEFVYQKKFTDYPYIVLTGFDKNVTNSYFTDFILPRIVEFMIFAIFFLFALHIFKTKTNLLLETEKNLRKAVEAANQAKERLIHSISHDIRNYIFGIGGLIDLVLSEQKNTKTLIDDDLNLLQEARIQTDELRYFVEDLLDSSQNSSGNFNLGELVKTDLKALISKVLLLNSRLISNNKVVANATTSKDLPELLCDPRRIRQILHNLVSNAVKYSKEDGRVLISAVHQKEQNQIIIEITDQGFGMNEEEIASYLTGDGGKIDKSEVFQNKKIESYGIGMSTVLRLIELHHGKIKVESKKGVGTKVKIYFPLR